MDERNIYSNANKETTEAGVMSENRHPASQYGDSFSRGDTAEINGFSMNGASQNSTLSRSYSYEQYRSQFDAPRKTGEVQTKKKSGKGSKTALIACSLALAVCLGFGGGVLGSYIMNKGNNQTVTASAEGKVVTATTAEGNSSDLKIVESSNVKNSAASGSIPDVVKKVKDSVVEITTEATSYSSFYGQYVTQGAGSGVIISADGYVLTNNHVVEGATEINITLSDGNKYKAEVVGTDETYDIALLKIDADNLTVATIGSSSELLVGETAIVIGNPLGKLGGSVSAGIISSSNRYIQIDGKSMELLQTDAAINPGNSGGGLFDSEGNLVGIVVAKSVQTSDGTAVDNIGYAIPIDNVKAILGDLKSKGYVSGRAMLGVNLVDVLTDTALSYYGVDKKGVYVSNVNTDSAAEKAGITIGDMIVSFDGEQVNSSAELTAAVLKKKAGDKVKMVVYRDGKEVTLEVTLDERTSTNSTKKNSNGFKPGGNSEDNNSGRGNNGNYGYGDFDDIFRDFGF